MTIRCSRLLPLSILAALALAAPACSCGDDDGGGDRPDARVTADSTPEDDADTGGLLRSGTIAVTEAEITNTIGAGDPWSGALVRVGFSDATTGNAPPPAECDICGTQPLNACVIRVWDVGTHESSDPVDEGVVSVVGTSNGPFVCGFASADLGYVCQSTEAGIAGGTAGNADGFILTGAGDTLLMTGFEASATMAGMYLVLSGFPPIPDGTRIPILAVDEDTDTLTLFNINDALTLTGDENSTFSTFVGIGPIPDPGGNFLAGAANDFTVQKEAGEIVPLIDEAFNAHGQGFTLVDDGAMGKYLPHNLPTDDTAATFECSECGVAGMGGSITAIVINGETTDATVGPLDPSNPMPDPETQYATFQCSFFVTEGEEPFSGTLSAEAMTIILDTNPKRIQTAVGRYRGAILTDDANETSTTIVQGHAMLGWTDVE